MGFNTIKEILDSGVFLKLTTEELNFLLENIDDRDANSPPDSYNVYGKRVGSGNSAPFRFYSPIVEKSKDGTNKIVGFSWKPFSSTELLGTSGSSGEKNRSPINVETTKGAIELARFNRISKREAIAIIRARLGMEQSQFPYEIREPITDSNLPKPLQPGFVPYGNELLANRSGYTGGTNFATADDLKKHLISIKRSQRHLEKIITHYNILQSNLSNGNWKLTFSLNGSPIVYELVPNPYFEEHGFGTESSNANLNSISDANENPNNLPKWVPEKVKKPVQLDLSEFYSLSEEEKSLDSVYVDLLMSGKNVKGDEIPELKLPNRVNSQSFRDLFTPTKENNSYATVSGAVYGSKNYVYAGFFAAMFTRSLFTRYGLRIPFANRIIINNPNGYTDSALDAAMSKLELNLTSFKIFKDAVTLDPVRTVRDFAAYEIGHKIIHTFEGLKDPRFVLLKRNPWAGGWIVAGLVILYDLLQPVISEKIEENKIRDRYIEALESQNHDNPNSVYYNKNGSNFNWKSLKPGEAIDPGMAIFKPDVIVPIKLDEDGENYDPPIGIETDKNGNPIVDPVTKRPIFKYPKRRKYKTPVNPNVRRFQNYHIPIDEIGMKDDIESNTIQEHLGNLADAHANSDLEYIPESSIIIPYRQQESINDPSDEYRGGDDLVNPFPDENITDANPNGLSPILSSEFFVREPGQTGVVYIYGEKLIYPNNAPTGNSNTNQTSNQTMDSTFIRSGG